jgi:hypothetical protein
MCPFKLQQGERVSNRQIRHVDAELVNPYVSVML